MTKQKRLKYISITFEEDVKIKKDSKNVPFISVKGKLKNGKQHDLMTFSKYSIKLLKDVKSGESKNLYGHFGNENTKGEIDNYNVFFPMGLCNPQEIILNKLLQH